MENSQSNNDPLGHLTLLELFALAERISRPTSDIDDLCEKVTFIVDLLNTDRPPGELHEMFTKPASISNPLFLKTTQQRLDDEEGLLKDREAAITKRELDINARERTAATKEEALTTRNAEIIRRETLRDVKVAEGEQAKSAPSPSVLKPLSRAHMGEWFDSEDGSNMDTPTASETEEESSCPLGSFAESLQTSTHTSSTSAAYEFFGSDDESDGIATPPGSEADDN